MKEKRRSRSFILTAFCTCALLLAVAGTSAFSFRRLPDGQNRIRQAAPRAIDTPSADATIIPGIIPTVIPGISSTETPGMAVTETPGVAATETPGATETVTPDATATATTTPGAITAPQGTYVGEVPTNNAWVAFDSNGKDVMAFVTDGSKDHPVTFAQWYKGTLQNNKVTAVASKAEEGKVEATFTKDTVTGTVTQPDGTTFPFTADVLKPTTSNGAASEGAGLYRGEEKINGQDYVGGWILAPNTMAITPSATGTPSLVPSTRTPSTILSPTVTATPAISGLIQGGGLYNKQTDKVRAVPELTLQDIAAKKVTIPGLGDFKLAQCQQKMC